MFRLTAQSVARTAARRNISGSAPKWVRIRSSNPANPPQTPSPAERPPAPPAETGPSAARPAFEPEVSKAGALPESVASAQAATETSSSTTSSDGTAAAAGETPPNTPLENPSPAELDAAKSGAPLEAEVDAIPDKPDLSQLPSLDIDPDVALPEPDTEGGDKDGKRTGAKEREYVSSMERTRKAYIRFLLATMGLGGIAGVIYMGQGEEGDQQGSWWDRVTGNTSEMMDIFNKPAFTKLLPDPLPPTHQRPYTLLVDLDGMLVSSTWDRAHGWRTVKRPGVDYFLSYLSQFYEVVLFSTQPAYTAMNVAEKLDPVGAFMPYKLYRDATRFHNGKVVKDLAYLNRDLSKVVMLDTDVGHGALQPDNMVGIKAWDGKAGDRGLVDMIPFLESIAMFNVKDVRPILKAYQGKDIPVEYAKKEAEAKRVAIEEWERRNPNAGASAGAGWLGGMFGGVAPNTSKVNQPMTFLDQKRAEAQRAYQLEQKYYKEHEEEYKKMIEEDKARQMAEMKGSLLGFFGGGGGGQPKPETKA